MMELHLRDLGLEVGRDGLFFDHSLFEVLRTW